MVCGRGLYPCNCSRLECTSRFDSDASYHPQEVSDMAGDVTNAIDFKDIKQSVEESLGRTPEGWSGLPDLERGLPSQQDQVLENVTDG